MAVLQGDPSESGMPAKHRELLVLLRAWAFQLVLPSWLGASGMKALLVEVAGWLLEEFPQAKVLLLSWPLASLTWVGAGEALRASLSLRNFDLNHWG